MVKLYWQDGLFFIAIAMNFGAYLSTIFLLAIVQAQVGNSAFLLEQNVFNRLLLSTQPLLGLAFLSIGWALIIVFVYMPARALAKGGEKRKLVPEKKLWKVEEKELRLVNPTFAFNMITLLVFFILCIDFINDFAYVIKLLVVR